MKSLFTLALALFFTTFQLIGQIQPVVTNLNYPYRLAINGNDLYFTEIEGNKISKINLNYRLPLSEAEAVLNNLNGPLDLLINGNDLYYSESTKISKIDLNNPDANPIEIVIGLTDPDGLVLEGNDLYFTNGTKISKISLNNSPPNVTDIVTGLNSPVDLIIQGNDMYVAQKYTGEISKIDLRAKSPTAAAVMRKPGSTPTGLLLHANYLYVADLFGSKLLKIDLSVNAPYTLPEDILLNVAGPTDLLVHGNTLYFTEAFDNRISKLAFNTLSTEDNNLTPITAYPNPAQSSIHITGLTSAKQYNIYNSIGSHMNSGEISNNTSIDINHLSNGVYFLTFQNGTTIPFIKE
ncbi:T9SS type A sorting domain-containing protein [Mangrovimonas xylaniphaga]|uniref:T9SS type A sorting domain-containing protein n=1 Tax=Mangrovimonas xylaniphaga TaxID=1645915 RepID=UPI0006B4CFC6|nr:T9SS type A sorting domain-containing protein [Mangrovimonas xylaniphaga]